MDFVNKLKYQENKLNSSIYLSHILCALRNDDDDYPIDIDENESLTIENARDDFLDSIPVNFARFLSDCSQLLNENVIPSPINFEDININFLICVIYEGLRSENTLCEADSIPIQAISLFLTLNTEKYINVIQIEEIVFKNIFCKILDVLEERIFDFKKISPEFLMVLNKFLTTNHTRIDDLQRLVKVLHSILYIDSSPINWFDIEETEEFFEKSTSIMTYICLKTLVMKWDISEGSREIVNLVSIQLVEDSKDEMVNKNIVFIFQNVLHQHHVLDWYLPLLVMLLSYTESKLYVEIINKLPKERHEDIVNVIVNKYVQANNDDEIETYLNILQYIIELPYQDIPDERREKLVKRILTETYYQCARNSDRIREKIMIVLTSLFQMRDIYVRRHTQQLFQSSSKMSAAHLFEILQEGIDISWRESCYNTKFIILTCRLFLLNKPFITQYRMRVLEMLTYKAAGQSLKPSLSVIIEVIKFYASQSQSHPILRSLLTLMVNNALSGSNIGKYYLKQFYDLLENCMIATNDCEVDFTICNVILSDDFNCLELFKMFQANGYIGPEQIKALVQEKILKYPNSWKLLTILLENTDYTEFPPYMEHYFEKFQSAEVFMCPECLYIVQTMSKIFMAKIKNNLIDERDKKLAGLVENCLVGHVKKMMVLKNHIGEVLILILHVNKITKTSTEWCNELFEKSLRFVFDNITCHYKMPALARYLMYLEHLLIVLNMNMNEENIRRLLDLLAVHNPQFIAMQVSDSVYAGLVTFLGKICLKYPNNIERAKPIFRYAMMTESTLAQMMAMSCLYDVSNLRLHCFDSMHADIFRFIKSKNMDLKNMAVKFLIKLVNDDHIELNCTDFITLLLILVEKNYRICPHFVDVLEGSFIHRNQYTISKYFVNLLFYLNEYRDHPLYPVENIADIEPEHDTTFARRLIIYRVLFCNLDRMKQLQILKILNNQFLLLFYKGRINPTPWNLNIVRDILYLVCFYASEYAPNNVQTRDAEKFYEQLFDDMNRDIFTNNRSAETESMELDETLQELLFVLIRLLYQFEKSHKSMLPTVFATTCVLTRALYEKILQIVNSNKKLKELYYQLKHCYDKHKEIIKTEPLDILRYCDKEEMRLYVSFRV